MASLLGFTIAIGVKDKMTIIDLGKHRKLRVWAGSLPPAEYNAANTVSLTIPAGQNTVNGGGNVLWLVALEFSALLGPRSVYGLLGGEFRPAPTNHLDVEICIGSTDERFENNLAARSDHVCKGLPSEYLQGVLDGLALAKGELRQLAAGRLLLNRAAHGVSGSSGAVFKHLAAALLKLLNYGGQEPSAAELQTLFPTTFN